MACRLLKKMLFRPSSLMETCPSLIQLPPLLALPFEYVDEAGEPTLMPPIPRLMPLIPDAEAKDDDELELVMSGRSPPLLPPPPAPPGAGGAGREGVKDAPFQLIVRAALRGCACRVGALCVRDSAANWPSAPPPAPVTSNRCCAVVVYYNILPCSECARVQREARGGRGTKRVVRLKLQSTPQGTRRRPSSCN